tara:strand:- start:416 stop:907 length:492 start_codon:yes stop_codon:yes gene_type:complete
MYTLLCLFLFVGFSYGFSPMKGSIMTHSSMSNVNVGIFTTSSSKRILKMQGGGPGTLDDRIRDKLQTMVDDNKVLLFMKGNKLFPQCGFSNTACRILDAINVPYETVNVLEDDNIRNGIKVFSSWPTIPQLYVDGEFVGGSDIMIEMYQNGELAEMIEVATAS